VSESPLVGSFQADKAVVAGEVDLIDVHVEKQQSSISIAGREIGTVRFTVAGGGHLERLFVGVPSLSGSLVGRGQAIQDLQAQLTMGYAVARVSLHGLPGAGKSTLAQALIYDHAVLEHFGGGVLWAALGPQGDPGVVLGRWGDALGHDVSEAATADERAQRLAAYLQRMLGGKPFLLVLDDVWRWEQAQPFLSFTLPGAALLLTTRDEGLARRFGKTATTKVPELNEDQALGLLRTLSPVAWTADPEGMRELARATGGLPLALVLIGSRLAEEGDQQQRWVRQAVEALRAVQTRLQLEEEQARPGMAGVPLTLQAVIELSLTALPDEESRQAFAQLGVFAPKPADWSLVAARAVWQSDDAVGDQWMRLLQHRGLLESTGEDRFTLHQVLKDVALTRLDQPSAAAERHFDYYLSLVNRDPEDWRAIEVELPQIRQAWDWVSTTSGRDAHVLELVWAMRLYIERRGLGTTSLAWYERALRAARELGQAASEGTLLNNIGAVHQRQGELDHALSYYEQALPIHRAVGDRSGDASTLNNIGLLHQNRGELDQALEYYTQALRIQRAVGGRAGEAATLNNIGLVHKSRGELDQALAHYTQALPISREVRDAAGEATILNNIAAVHRSRSELDKALDYYAKALPIRHAVGDRAGEATTLNNIGLVHQSRGDLDQALDYFLQALPIHRAVGDRAGEATTLTNIGGVHQSRRELPYALDYFLQALPILRAVGDRAGEATTLNNIGGVHYSRGELDQALDYYGQALPIMRAVGDRAREAITLVNIGQVHQSRGEPDRALDYCGQALPIMRAVGDRAGEAITLINIGQVHQSRGELAEAVAALERAVELDEVIGSPDLERHLKILERVRNERHARKL
jgi:tetratricopeptide (TPR) repeat protein